MPKATVQRKIPLENTVALERHALGTLQYIRASIDAAGLLAVPGSAGIAMGSVGVLAALTVSIPTLAPHWFGIWSRPALRPSPAAAGSSLTSPCAAVPCSIAGRHASF